MMSGPQAWAGSKDGNPGCPGTAMLSLSLPKEMPRIPQDTRMQTQYPLGRMGQWPSLPRWLGPGKTVFEKHSGASKDCH